MSLLPGKRVTAPVSLLRLIWRSYLTSALVPVFLIELALIAAYLIANSITREQNIMALQSLATEQLQYISRQQARNIGSQLASVAFGADLLRRQTERALVTPFVPDAEEASRYALSQEGILHTTHGRDGRAEFIHFKQAPSNESDRGKALRLAQLDPLLKGLVETHPLVIQSYVITADRMLRKYPFADYTDTLARLGQDNDPTSYDFYYLADAEHDPERKVIWTDVSVDPSGYGWASSANAPVYPNHGDRLEAVVGVDISVGNLVKEVLSLQLPWKGYGVLVSKTGTILALPKQGEQDWGLRELTQYSYSEPVQHDIGKPDSFNLLKRDDSRILGHRMTSTQQGLETLSLAGRDKLVSWSTVKDTGWKLMVVVDEAEIFAEAYELNRRLLRVGLGMIAGLILFYVLFFSWLYRKVRWMSGVLAKPLLDLEAMMQRIGHGEYAQPQPAYPIVELQRTGEGLVQMGRSLGQSDSSLRQARADLELLNTDLEGRIRQRTRELEVINAALNQENEIKQTLIQQLQRTQGQLVQSEKLASMVHLASGIAHELKNPLNFIHNLSEVSAELSAEIEQTMRERPQSFLMEVRELVGDLKLNAATIHQHSRRADAIIQGMMEHARGRSGAFALTDVQALVEQSLTLVYQGERIRSPNLELNFVREFESATTRVHAISQQLGRVIQNLIHNAIYAVSARRRESDSDYVPTITLRIRREGDNVVLQVEDNGLGIPRHIQNRIFEPFFTTKPPGGGNTGLGLSLSYDIIKLHLGSLTVESELGEFTCFTVIIPAATSLPDGP